MLRRSFIAGASCAILSASLAPRVAAEGGDARELQLLDRLIGLYRRLRAFGDVWAEDITKIKLARFLNGVQDPLNELLHEKQNVLRVLASGRCAGDAGLMTSVAFEAAAQINALLGVLGEKMRVLSTAIKPRGLRAEAAALGDSLAELRQSKMWLERINAYCRMAPADRLRFLDEVRTSVRLVRQARNELNALLDKLG